MAATEAAVPAAPGMEDYMEPDEIFSCTRCGEILEEGKAYELSGLRWHINCFRCNTCDVLLDSDANLHLLGDRSLICSTCTYSCSACGVKIEDLAILTGDQAFCATCFRCRNCKRKIENLRYARTSVGIFCMTCQDTMTARRKKKAKAARAAKQREKDGTGSPMITEKSLPALPPAIDKRHDGEPDAATELSPRPRQHYTNHISDVLNGASATVADRTISESPVGQKNDILLPSTTYGSSNTNSTVPINRSSTLPDGSVDLDNFFTPMSLDPSVAAPPARPTTSTSLAPHIFFQEKGRLPSGASESSSLISQQQSNTSSIGTAPTRKPSKSSRSDARSSHYEERSNYSPPRSNTGAADEFKLQDAPKSKKLSSSPISQSSDMANFAGLTNNINSSSKSSSYATSNTTSRVSQDDGLRPDPNSKHLARKDVPSNPTVRSSLNKPNPITRTLSDSAPPRPIHNEAALSHATAATPSSNTKLSNTYTQPRPAPAPPVAPREPSTTLQSGPTPPNPLTQAPPVPGAGAGASRNGSKQSNNGISTSPTLPIWSSGAEFTLDEDMARIMGNDEGSSILRRVSNAVRHGRTNSTEMNVTGSSRPSHTRSISETTRSAAIASGQWPKTPTKESNGLLHNAHDIQSPGSLVVSPNDDAAFLKRQLRSSELRVAELERQADTEKNLHALTQKLTEKRKTVAELDTQTELMIRQVEVLAGYADRAKQTSMTVNIRELEDLAIADFIDRLEQVKISMSEQIEKLYAERSLLLEEKEHAVAERDRALMEFEQLSSKNAQLADMNNDLTHQIQERFKAQINMDPKSPNGLGIYGASKLTGDGSSIHTGTTLLGGDNEDTIVEAGGPMVVNIRKGQVKKFNWKKGSKTLAQNVGKGVSKAAAAFQNDKERAAAGQPGYLAGDNIGMPYNMTVAQVDAPVTAGNPNGRKDMHLEQQRQGFGFFKKSGQAGPGANNGGNNGNNLQIGKSMSGSVSTPAVAEAPSTLFGSDLTERADYERRQIPCVVTRCIEEVELRGMDVEGIYRKTGGNSQVKMVQDGFDKDENYDISDPVIDITAVTSVLKQYFRKLPTPLFTFDIYNRILESNAISDPMERCSHLSRTFRSMPQRHQDTLEFLMFHLSRVAKREPENLMSPKNLAVVFAPTIMRDTSIEREMTDMHAKNIAVQFVIENSEIIFSE
ncbi:N-chimaerin [Ceratocystis fimbriata CBS 114723]|uniref:N-chimaerin n=1 Tax=Ceratocystis fimbriata CBS 114723 TaxID=1035309 RepID=A0A2C5XC84_9PEZI|nr:N-chimaerin [Ceratocystis fimbriata CBS 114723]